MTLALPTIRRESKTIEKAAIAQHERLLLDRKKVVSVHRLKSKSHLDVHSEVLRSIGPRYPDLAALLRFNLTIHTHSVGPERVMGEIRRCKNVSQHNMSLHTLNSKLLIRFNDVDPRDMNYQRVLQYVQNKRSHWKHLEELDVYDYDSEDDSE